MPSPTFLTISFGADSVQLPWSSRHRTVDVARNLVALHTPELVSWLCSRYGCATTASSSSSSLQAPHKVLVEVVTNSGAFVCADVQQLEETLRMVGERGGTSSDSLNVEAVVLAAAMASTVTADGRPMLQKLYRRDIQLLQGSLEVILDSNEESVGRIAFDKSRGATLLELEDAVEELPWVTRWRRSNEKRHEEFVLGWRLRHNSNKMPKLSSGPSPSSTTTMRIDGEADTKALSNDVRVYGHDHVLLVVVLPDRLAEKAAQEGGVPLRKATHHTAAPAVKKGTAMRNVVSPINSRPERVVAVVEETFEAEDNDVDYIAISYVLNPPVITVIGFMEEPQLKVLSDTIIQQCVSAGRVAALRTGPPAFSRSDKNAGVFPVYHLSLTKWYFSEVQELALTVAILDAMSELRLFRMVPLDGSCEKESANSIHEQRARSRMMLNMGGARAVVNAGDSTQVASKRSAQFFFVPK